MTPRTRRTLALLPAAALTALLLTACGTHSGTADHPDGKGSASPTAPPSDLAQMRELVDDADSAASAADSDAAADK